MEETRMRKHFISVLGTGQYKEASYSCGGKSYSTCYVQEALLKLKFERWEAGDKITVFLTEEAKKRNWLDRPYTEKEQTDAEAAGKRLPKIRTGLKSILEREYEEYLDDTDLCMIPIGADEEELWRIFQVIFESIREEEELYIDITHALRNIPVQMLAVSVYARTIKKIQIGGIYYGAFEVKNKNEKGVIETPVLDLITFLNILDWSQAANTFIKYGNSEQIKDLYYQTKQRERQQKKSQEKEPLKDLVDALYLFTHGLENCRGYYETGYEIKDKKGKSIQGAYKNYKNSYQKIQEMNTDEAWRKNKIQPLGGLLQVMDDKMASFDVDTNFETGVAAIQWSIDHKQSQQGLTALDESIKTFLCNYYGLNEKKKRDREDICKSICNELSYTMQRRHVKELTKEIREEACGEWVQRRQEETEDTRIAKKIFDTIPGDLVVLCKNIADIRNSMNHFGYSNPGQFDCSSLDKKLKDYYRDFLCIIKDAKECQGVDE